MSDVTYPSILAGLQDRVVWLDLRVAILDTILDERSEDMVRAAPIIFGPLAGSLLHDVLLTIAKLYERGSDRSIHKLVNVAEQQCEEIQWRYPPSAALFAGNRKAIDEQEEVLRSIKGRRDKSIAHYDKQYFHNLLKLDEDFPLSSRAVIEVVRVTQEILASHTRALDGSAAISWSAFASVATKSMLLVLAAEAKQRRSQVPDEDDESQA